MVSHLKRIGNKLLNTDCYYLLFLDPPLPFRGSISEADKRTIAKAWHTNRPIFTTDPATDVVLPLTTIGLV
jgi:hypothetical protein